MAAATSAAATSAASSVRWPHTSSPKSRCSTRKASSANRELARKSIEQHGGRYLVPATLPEAAEGDWPSQRRLVILEFPDMDTVRRWYASEDYARALVFRDRALNRRLTFVDGV
jgi:uncharacterized protein (DUF1330 family)